MSFAVAGIHPHDLAELCNREAVAIRAGHHCAQPLMRRLGVPATARASFSVYNTTDDVDRLIDALENAQKCVRRLMDPLYREFILDHYKNPRNFGDLPQSRDAEFDDRNPLCGDEMGVHIKLDGDRIEDLRFHGQVCAISQATASIISDELKGKTVAEVAKLDRRFVAEEIGIELSPTRLKCGLLSLKVVQGALLGTDEWPSGTPDEDPDEADVARLRNEI